MNALEELRENLREAAQRDVGVERARTRRRRWRATAAVVLTLIGGGAAAQATDLIDSGRPAPNRPQPHTYRPAGGERRQIIAKVHVDGVVLPFGVVVYNANNGKACALAGLIRGTEIGDLVGSTFRPYTTDRAGSCGVPTRLFLDWVQSAGHAVLFGRASPGTRTVVLRETGEAFRVGKDGAFLFVLPHQQKVTLVERT